MCLVREDKDVMFGIERLCVGLIELLNQGKDKAGVTPKFINQIIATGGNKLPSLGFAQQAAVFKGIADLLV